MKKWLKRIGLLLLLGLVALTIMVFYNWRDRYPDYTLDLHLKSKGNAVMQVGFAKKPITPTIVDTWNDADGNFKYDEDKGDTYNDNNNNGKFDAYWIAGMSNAKPAQGVHDDVWSRVVVMDDGNTRMALVSLDAIGFLHDDVIDIRQRIPQNLGVDYTLIASTHTHESNDLVGIWGPDPLHSGVNPEMLEYVKTQTVAAITEAVGKLRPAELVFAEDRSQRDSILMKDTRKPIVKATGVHVMQAIDAQTKTTLGTLVDWANHPETLWSKNLLISSDYPHYIREAMENGIKSQDSLIKPGLGGISVFFSGAIGGLMAPHPSISIPDIAKDTLYAEPTYEKTQAVGEHVALMALEALEQKGDTIAKSGIDLRARTLEFPLDNTMFKIASAIGLIKMGMPSYFSKRSEVGAIRVGPALFLSIPGEIYPEIVYGGVEAPRGREFEIDPIETPSIESFIKDKYKFYLGLANDEIGYIIPKSEWDTKKPYLYHDERDTYGEENSLGPETGPLVYYNLLEVIRDLDE
ncbi:hypothetical protein [Sediminicola luteus]|uniref:Neutral/alkaline non-lysosomal ceramidase N-terminal domain-containing protein n=1 Tax=Sediminicola luteus TaxID=319238 RepID=A0A2A4G9T8_9FLAO|nr:hypothetical protein [Sediminicola luteus]PCE64738.1 hypothetical protein B7P33_06090 [Sediminicola luteus]